LIVGPGWTLSFELYFYLCFAAVMVAGRTRALVLLSAFFFVAILLGAQFRPSNAFLKVATSHLLLEFLAGAAIGLLYLSRHTVSAGLAKLAVAVAGLGFLASVSADDMYPTVLVWGAPSALLVFGLAMWEKSGAMPAAVDRGAPLGDSSYLLYLIHTLLFDVALKLLLSLGAAPEFGWLWISLVVGLAILVASIMHERVEKPLNAWLARLFLRRNKSREASRVQAA
jgi:exopolysaccharide production protein ExoZ